MQQDGKDLFTHRPSRLRNWRQVEHLCCLLNSQPSVTPRLWRTCGPAAVICARRSRPPEHRACCVHAREVVPYSSLSCNVHCPVVQDIVPSKAKRNRQRGAHFAKPRCTTQDGVSARNQAGHAGNHAAADRTQRALHTVCHRERHNLRAVYSHPLHAPQQLAVSVHRPAATHARTQRAMLTAHSHAHTCGGAHVYFPTSVPHRPRAHRRGQRVWRWVGGAAAT